MVTFYRKREYQGDNAYSVLSDTPDHFGNHPKAWARMHREKETPQFREWAHTDGEGSPSDYQRTGWGSEGQLFEHTSGQVSHLFAHPDMRAHIPTLLGIMAQDHQRSGSKSLPLPDGDLSPHSSGMIRNLRAKGVAIPVNRDNPDSHVTNDISLRDQSWSGRHDTEQWDGAKIVPDHEVAAGRQFTRNLLRKPKPTGGSVSPQQFGTQGTLF